MTLEEINARICSIRCEIEELQEEVHQLWIDADDSRTEELADYIENELGIAAAKMSELEDMEVGDEGETDEELEDWWYDLPVDDKETLSGIPYPTSFSGRGDEDYEFTERTSKWWNSRTSEQKRDLYDEFNAL